MKLDDEDESEESDDDDEDEVEELEEELELLSRFLATGFFPLPLCSCSSCLASSLCSICSFLSRAISSSFSKDFSHSPLSTALAVFCIGFTFDVGSSFLPTGLRLLLRLFLLVSLLGVAFL